jgi:glycopeptide antibiotics resistance protein
VLCGGLPWLAIRLAGRVCARRAATEALFAGYLGALFFIVFLIGIPVGAAKEISPTWASFNLVPGRTVVGIVRDYPDRIVWQLIGNILLFVPLGFFLPWLSARCRRFATTVSIGLAVSVGIELAQLVMLVTGLSRRAVDVDDVILNVTGACLGYLAWRARERA